MNKTLAEAGRNILKTLIVQCNDNQQMTFKKLYSPRDLDLHIMKVIEKMDDSHIDTAISQCERTIENNNKNVKLKRGNKLKSILEKDDSYISEVLKKIINRE
jgi:hypothetical protein